MSKKNKIICVILSIIFIVSIIITGIVGLNVSLEYKGGVSITIYIEKQYDNKEIKEIAKEIWQRQPIIVQKVEIAEESVSIKVKETTEEQLETLLNKINEKYNTELKRENIEIFYNTNVKLRDIITPYVVPLIIATGLIVLYYSIKFKGVKEILELLIKLIAVEGIIYSIYAIFRLPVSSITMPIGMIAYAGVVIWVTMKSEMIESDKN